ncbi:MAG TPA: hypothetical protein VF814_04635 [Casimicrobiaceae bacterium]
MAARLTLVVAAAMFAAVLLGSGCAGWSQAGKNHAYATVSADVLECGVDNYATAKNAITLGGAAGVGDWLSAIIGVFQCIPQVVRDIEASQAMALLELELEDPSSVMMATAEDDTPGVAPLPPRVMSKNARRRLAAAKVLGQVLNQSVVRK